MGLGGAKNEKCNCSIAQNFRLGKTFLDGNFCKGKRQDNLLFIGAQKQSFNKFLDEVIGLWYIL